MTRRRSAALAVPSAVALAVGLSAGRAAEVEPSATPWQSSVAETGPTTPVAPTLAEWVPDVDSAKGYALTRQGRVRFAVYDETTGRRWGFRETEQVHCASLLKTLLMATYLRQSSVRDRALTEKDRGLLRPMIRESANAPASTLVVRLGSDAIARTAKAAGMGAVRVTPHWGQTATSARQQIALYTSLPRLVPGRHREYAMKLLGTIVPAQRWGVAQVDVPDGWSLAFKGGWGSGSGAVDHQSALLTSGDRRVVLSITTTTNPSHKVGKATLKGVATRLLRDLPN